MSTTRFQFFDDKAMRAVMKAVREMTDEKKRQEKKQ